MLRRNDEPRVVVLQLGRYGARAGVLRRGSHPSTGLGDALLGLPRFFRSLAHRRKVLPPPVESPSHNLSARM